MVLDYYCLQQAKDREIAKARECGCELFIDNQEDLTLLSQMSNENAVDVVSSLIWFYRPQKNYVFLLIIYA